MSLNHRREAGEDEDEDADNDDNDDEEEEIKETRRAN